MSITTQPEPSATEEMCLIPVPNLEQRIDGIIRLANAVDLISHEIDGFYPMAANAIRKLASCIEEETKALSLALYRADKRLNPPAPIEYRS
ncbi:hypothetical protein [Hyphomicrobium sulfonivorans]|uniref:hypothetical protein n=1 Tax=Hyphomicrobium sulfonivorans TaxID=121290 RepID=UPI00156DDEE9|nr:hypothetical protein [Hyphomicrobium sulfonivorans]MBI1650127.1 hypothetical protein [Hyphomicrobium sulfonivorans]